MGAGEQKTRIPDFPDDFPVFRHVVYDQTETESYRKRSGFGLCAVFYDEFGVRRLRCAFQWRDNSPFFRPGADEMVLCAPQLPLNVRQSRFDVLFYGYFW